MRFQWRKVRSETTAHSDIGEESEDRELWATFQIMSLSGARKAWNSP